jgi:hypothetical protein
MNNYLSYKPHTITPHISSKIKACYLLCPMPCYKFKIKPYIIDVCVICTPPPVKRKEKNEIQKS